MINLAIGLSVVAFVMASVCMVLCILSISYSVGLKNSTHQIQYVPLNDGVSDETVKSEFEDALSTSFDDDDMIQV